MAKAKKKKQAKVSKLKNKKVLALVAVVAIIIVALSILLFVYQKNKSSAIAEATNWSIVLRDRGITIRVCKSAYNLTTRTTTYKYLVTSEAGWSSKFGIGSTNSSIAPYGFKSGTVTGTNNGTVAWITTMWVATTVYPSSVKSC